MLIFLGWLRASLCHAQAAWQRGCCTARNEAGEGKKTWCWCGDCFPSGRAGAWRQGSPQGTTVLPLITLTWKEPRHCVQFPLWRQPLRFLSSENRQQFHLSRHNPVCLCFWGLKAVPGSQQLFHAFTASSSQQLHLPRWHLLCCSPTSQMLAFRRCPGKQPCSVLRAVEGSMHLSTSMHRECDFAGDLCPASSLSASSAVPWPSSTEPPGKGRRHEKLPEDAQKCTEMQTPLWLYDGTIRGHKQGRVLGCAKTCPTGGVKVTPKCLAVMQLNFGNGFLYKLVFHLRQSQ